MISLGTRPRVYPVTLPLGPGDNKGSVPLQMTPPIKKDGCSLLPVTGLDWQPFPRDQREAWVQELPTAVQLQLDQPFGSTLAL